jgi:hypothetical protein
MSAVYHGPIASIVLTSSFATKNPVTIASDGIVTGNTTGYGGAAVYASGYAWTIANAGSVAATGSKSNGVDLKAGGSVINGASNASAASISGVYAGIALNGAPSTVTNYGTVQGTGTAGVGVNLGSGGGVNNSGLISAYHIGVVAGTASNPATIVNYGTIESTQTATPITIIGYGVLLKSGGTVTNGSAADPNALISAADGKGIVIAGGVGSIVNFGQIYSSANSAANVNGGGRVSNYGTMRSTSTAHSDVYFLVGGTVINGSTGDRAALISGARNGIAFAGSAGTVVNYGTVASTSTGTVGSAIYLGAGGIVTNYGLLSGNRQLATNTTAGVIEAKNQPATVHNFGTIATTNTGFGVKIGFGGTVVNGASNATGALITGSADGVYIGGDEGVSHPGAQAFLYNYGTIAHPGTSGEGVRATSGGTVTNHGLITSEHAGIGFFNTAGTVINFGTVAVASGPKDKAGVYLGVGGQITNHAGAAITASNYGVALGGPAVVGLPNYNATAVVSNSGVLSGGIGVYIGSDQLGTNTIVNTGTIIGTSGTAVDLGTAGSALFVIESGSSLQGVITNMQPGDAFDLPFMTFSNTGTATVVSNGTVSQQLQIVENSSTFTIALDPKQNFSGDVFQLGTDSASGTLITEAPCFCRGTLILTDRGEVLVEALAIGDKVRTLAGALKPITWIGYGRRLITALSRNARPMIVRRDALADGVPCRDLRLTRAHSLYLDDILVPVEYLLNGCSVLWDESAREVEFYHIELRDHDVLIADGAPAESYREDGNRALFDNPDPPRFTTAESPWFAPVRTGGPEVDALWHRIVDRSGFSPPPLVDDPDLHLMVDGQRVDAIDRDARPHPFQGVYYFQIERPPAISLRIVSRQVNPAMVGLSRDPRQLGVAVRSVMMLDAQGPIAKLLYSSHLLEEGFNDPEPAEGHRWTTGNGTLPYRCLALYDGPFDLLLEIVCTAKYPFSTPISRLVRPAA